MLRNRIGFLCQEGIVLIVMDAYNFLTLEHQEVIKTNSNHNKQSFQVNEASQ
jgi:hypothetical protein